MFAELHQSQSQSNVQTQVKPRVSLLQRYLNFCDSQTKVSTFWLILTLISIPAVVMPIGIYLMSFFGWNSVFMTISMLLLFSNILVHLGEYSTRVTITVYLLTVLIHIVAPIIMFLS